MGTVDRLLRQCPADRCLRSTAHHGSADTTAADAERHSRLTLTGSATDADSDSETDSCTHTEILAGSAPAESDR